MAIKKTTPWILAGAFGIAAVGGGLLTSYAAPQDAQPASTYAPAMPAPANQTASPDSPTSPASPAPVTPAPVSTPLNDDRWDDDDDDRFGRPR